MSLARTCRERSHSRLCNCEKNSRRPCDQGALSQGRRRRGPFARYLPKANASRWAAAPALSCWKPQLLAPDLAPRSASLAPYTSWWRRPSRLTTEDASFAAGALQEVPRSTAGGPSPRRPCAPPGGKPFASPAGTFGRRSGLRTPDSLPGDLGTLPPFLSRRFAASCALARAPTGFCFTGRRHAISRGPSELAHVFEGVPAA
jgi:hypothetical protein